MIPDASRAILKQWQAKGLKFNVDRVENICELLWDFESPCHRYTIPEQPMPEGVTVEQAQAMWEQGLRLEFGRHGFNIVVGFNWQGGHYRGHELLAKLHVPFQPIPEKLLEEPLTVAKIIEFERLERDKCVAEDPPRVTESDPNGLDPHAPGAKLDAGKNRLSLVLGGFANALEAVGLVGTYGAEKYTPNGWKEVPDGVARYEDAMMRHWIEVKKGNEIDSTTMLSHRAQLIWNALAVLELMLKETK